MSKKKLILARRKIDQLDNKIFYLIKKRTKIVNYMIKIKNLKKQIVDHQRIKEILKKISLVKITKMIKLIQKTEILLRKNSSHYLEITQRFLLNFSKLMR